MLTREKLPELPAVEFAHVKDVLHVNHRPHPFMVDPRCVEVASRSYGGILNEEAMKTAGCGWRGERGNSGRRCGLPPADHTCDVVALVELRRDVVTSELRAWLKSLLPILEPLGVDGFTFLQGHKITDDEQPAGIGGARG